MMDDFKITLPASTMSVDDHLRMSAVIEFAENVATLHHFFEDGHAERCSTLAYDLAVELGMSMEDIILLLYATQLHDHGKIGISEHVLARKRVSKSEMDMIKGHPGRGADLIKNMRFDNRIENAIRHHHEWWNGKGYPDKLKGEDIPLFSRIVGIVDAFDGITSERVYHPVRTITEALEIMQIEAGIKFDPTLFAVFQRIVMGRSQDTPAQDDDYG